jgi:hypothetical protein
MSRKITKEHARRVVRKLKAEVITKRSAHDLAQVFYNGQLVVQFGLRRGSSKESGHGHLPEDLHLTQHQTLELARCPLSYDDWVSLMRERGLIQDEEGN